jgi:AGCS family alanine or glycine:cation symporter
MGAQLADALARVSGWVWGAPLITLLVGTGAYYSIILRGLPFRRLPEALHLAFIRRQDPDSPGDISHFQALMTALCATVGVGNIAGVATAIAIGGPGALAWMWLTGLVGMASKYAEAVLAVHFRVRNARGEMSGGPMHYIEQGMKQRWLAAAFAACAAVAAFGIGNMVQAHSVADGLRATFGMAPWLSGLVMSVGTALVLLGGVRAIGRAASVVAPVMIAFYMAAGCAGLWLLRGALWPALLEIARGAWAPTAAAGGFAGATLAQTMRIGIARGIFSNESGLGSSPIAAAAAQTKDPVRQALVSMTQTFLDTLVVCSVTGLLIVASGAWRSGATGAALTTSAFQACFGVAGGWIVAASLALFAYSTVLGWSYYGEKSVEYLAGLRAVAPYRWVFCGLVFVGSVSRLDAVWSFSDMMNGLMALPNLIALLALSPIVLRETRRYCGAPARR